MRKNFIAAVGGLLFLALLILIDLAGDWGRLGQGIDNLLTFTGESMWPPNWSVLEAQSYPVCEKDIEFFCSVGYIGMVETIKIAFVATILGFIGALSLSSFAAKNLMPMPIALVFESCLSIRSLHRSFGHYLRHRHWRRATGGCSCYDLLHGWLSRKIAV